MSLAGIQREVLPTLEGVQVLVVAVLARVRDLRGSVGAPMERALDGQHSGRLSFVSSPWSGHVKGIHVANAHPDRHTF